MKTYKKYFLRQLGIKESSIRPSEVDAEIPEIDPQDITDEPEVGNSEPLSTPSFADKMLSPTAIPTPVIGLAVRGSNTGGFPSGMDQTGIAPNTPTGRLGGYEPIPIQSGNSLLVNKTPNNSTIGSNKPIATDNSPVAENPHPHQVQKDVGEPPQNVTGAEVDGEASGTSNGLNLKDAAPKGIEIDISQEDDNAGEEAGPDENPQDGEDDKNGQPSTEKLNEVLASLAPKALNGKLSPKESQVFASIKEVLAKRKQIAESKKKFPWDNEFKDKEKKKKQKKCDGSAKCTCGCND